MSEQRKTQTMTDTQLANAMIDVLHRRKGFDWWWENCDAEARASIKREIGREVRRLARKVDA